LKGKEKVNLAKLVVLIGILVLPIAFIQLITAQEGQVTLNPTDDTYVNSNTQSSNYGGLSFMYISQYVFFDTPVQELVWLKFNLSSVPDGAVVDTATLQVYASYLTETYTVDAHSSSNNSWTELTLSYSNMPSFNATSMDSKTLSTAPRYYDWSVLDAVRSAVGGSDVVTIVLTEHLSHSSVSSVQFHSKENSLNIPKLVVHWSDVIPEFTPPAILPLFMSVTLLAVIVYKRRTCA
jgi:hypothetical protein